MAETWKKMAFDEDVLKKDGSVALTADWALGTHKITELVDPVVNQGAATKKYVDDNAGGASAINDLTDVVITGPADLDLLQYDNASSKWVDRSLAEAGIPPIDSPIFTTLATSPIFEAKVAAGDPKYLFNIGGVDKWYIGVDDSDGDKLKIGKGATVGSFAVVEVDESYNFNLPYHNAATIGLKLGGTLITASAAEINLLDGITGIANIKTGTYTGNAADDRDIDIGVDLASKAFKWLVTKAVTAKHAHMKWGHVAGDICSRFSTSAADAVLTNRLQAWTATGFQVGSDPDVNQNGVVYNYMVIYV